MGGSQFSVSLLTYQRVLPSEAHTHSTHATAGAVARPLCVALLYGRRLFGVVLYFFPWTV